MKKVLVVSEFIDPDQNSTGYFWYKIIQKLAQSDGIEQLSVIAPYSGDSEEVQKKFCSNIGFLLFLHESYDKNNLFKRLLGQVQQTFGFFKILLKNLAKDKVVVSGTNPLFLLVLLAFLKIFIPFKWYLLVHDVFPENLVPAGILKKNSVLFKIMNFIFNRIYSRADHLIVIGRDMKKLMRQKTGSDNVTVIPNWVDFTEIEVRQKQQSSIISSLGWNENIVFQFFGNMGRVQGISNLLAAINLITNSSAKFLFIGGGKDAQLVKEFAEDENNKNKVAYVGELAAQQRSLGLSSCDIAIVTLAEGMLGLGVPSKAYFTMAADRPILAIMEEDAEVAYMVKEHHIGWVCEPNNPVGLASLIDEICVIKLSKLSNSPRKILQDHFHQDKLLQSFVDIVES